MCPFLCECGRTSSKTNRWPNSLVAGYHAGHVWRFARNLLFSFLVSMENASSNLKNSVLIILIKEHVLQHASFLWFSFIYINER